MSVYIKGMEMPQNCRECPHEQPYDGYNCAINEKSYSWGLSSRPSDCPLIPVPDHGRLIDADALCNRLLTAWDTADKEKKTLISAVMADVVTPIVVGTPTIIPSDREDGAE